MPDDPTFAELQVERLETLLAEAVGLKTVVVNGTTTEYADLLVQYQFWKSKVAIESGAKQRIVRLDLSGF